MSPPATRKSATLLWKVNLPRAMNFGASCGENLVTSPPIIWGRRTLRTPQCGTSRSVNQCHHHCSYYHSCQYQCCAVSKIMYAILEHLLWRPRMRLPQRDISASRGKTPIMYQERTDSSSLLSFTLKRRVEWCKSLWASNTSPPRNHCIFLWRLHRERCLRGIRPIHHKSICLTKLTLGPNVAQIWSRNTLGSRPAPTPHSYTHGKCVEMRFAKVNSLTNPTTYFLLLLIWRKS